MIKIRNLIIKLFKNCNINTAEIIFIFPYTAMLYIFFSSMLTKSIFSITNRPYYNYLLDAIFHWRLNLTSPFTYDLSLFYGKWYLYYGPSPIIFISPFYLISGVFASDVFYTLIAGFLNIILFYILLHQFVKYFKINLSIFSMLFVLFSFAFASPNFYLSLGGDISATYHLIGIFYLLLSYIFYFKFLNNTKNLFLLVLSVIFFNLAWFSRYTLVFNALLFIYPLYLIYKTGNKKLLKKAFIIISSFMFISILLILAYNYLRFKDPFEMGLKYQKGSPRNEIPFKNNKIFSIDYIPYNFTYYFLNHLNVSSVKPFAHVNTEGNSVFSVYPVVFLLFFLFQKKYIKNKRYSLFLGLSFLIIFINLFFLMMYFATGWNQFGSRYFLDVVPLLYLLILFVLNDIPIVVLSIILLYGVSINFLGTLIYYGAGR